MKYEFSKHVGFENFNAEGKEKMLQRMIQVLNFTKVQVSIHILPKKERHFLCPIVCISESNGKLIMEKVSAFSREPFDLPLDKNKMVQIIKKALKNYTRKKALASLELSATL
jgi:hypothetical protein